jgi:hypothetical protein
MSQKPRGRTSSSEQIIRDIKRKTRKQYSAEEKTASPSCADGKALRRACISAKPALGAQMVQGLYGGGQEAPGRRH